MLCWIIPIMQKCDFSLLKKILKTKKNPKFNLFPCSPKFTEKYVWSCCSNLRLLTLFGPACHQNYCCKAHRWPPHSQSLVLVWRFLTVTLDHSVLLGVIFYLALIHFTVLVISFSTFLTASSQSIFFFSFWFLLIFLSSKYSSALGLRVWVSSFSVFTHFLGNFIELHSFRFCLYAYDSLIPVWHLDIFQVLTIHHLHLDI